MRNSFKVEIPPNLGSWLKETQNRVRVIVGALLLANLIALLFLFQPWGGSEKDLFAQLQSLDSQIALQQKRLVDLRKIVGKVQLARTQSDGFFSRYFLDRRTSSSTIVSELQEDEKVAGIKNPRATSFNLEPIEGSETLSILTVQADFDCDYKQLMQLLNRLDKSARFLIIESLSAAPRQIPGTISVSMKVSTFVREEGSAL